LTTSAPRREQRLVVDRLLDVGLGAGVGCAQLGRRGLARADDDDRDVGESGKIFRRSMTVTASPPGRPKSSRIRSGLVSRAAAIAVTASAAKVVS
jgi:hypothetical protein